MNSCHLTIIPSLRSFRGLRLHIQPRHFSFTPRSTADFTHVIIGAGAVGLSIARSLSAHLHTSTLLLERHSSPGTETSSRNSEVIHAGLYYGPSTLKTSLCLRGKQMMYDLCRQQNINHRNTGKWIVAQDAEQFAALEKIHASAREIGVPTRFLGREEAGRREPDVRALAGVLESESTGIVDSHGLMAFLEGEIQAMGGEVAFRTRVTGVRRLSNGEFEVRTRGVDDDDGNAKGGKGGEEEEQVITAETLVNSAGLAAIGVSNMILPPERQLKAYYAKGTYFSYSAPRPKPGTLVYPAPVPGHGGLGTHLTLDLSVPPRVRFGPDVEWVEDPSDYTPNEKRMEAAIDDIQAYLPGIERDKIEVDYCGIRPKLGREGSVTSGKGFQDFYIKEEKGFKGLINLLGIESPGLTSSLAIGEYVSEMLYGKSMYGGSGIS